MYLVVVDTAQIQPYIFGSNRLRENIGASHLVAEATETWAFEAVRTATKCHNVQANGTLDSTQHIENTPELEAEVLYAGGGNFVVLFRQRDGATAFTRTLSRRGVIDAPNLRLVVARQPFDWYDQHTSLAQALKAAFKKLTEEKRARALSAPILGLGVTVMCQSTGMPAVDVTEKIGDDPGYPAAAEILAKLAVARPTGEPPSAADVRLREIIPPPNGYVYPGDFDHLGGSKGEHSYIGVVHADGNGVGQRLLQLGKQYATWEKNRPYITALRQFSDAVKAAARVALRRTVAELEPYLRAGQGNAIVHKNAAGKLLAQIILTEASRGRYYLPFRPLVFGGDDVTFVCDGRLGLSLAIAYIRAFEEETGRRAACGGKLTACAGIAIVKTHYPFARAYALAEELCDSAKKYRREKRPQDACLNWHFALGGLAGRLEDIHRREYEVPAGSLSLRPVALEAEPGKGGYRVWSVVQKGIDAFQGKQWAGRRNKIKALREALRDGEASVQHFLTRYNAGDPLPDVESLSTNLKTSGWHGGLCGYFDAIELADWFIPCTGGNMDDAGTTPGTIE